LGQQNTWLDYNLWLPSPNQLVERVKKLLEKIGTPLAVFAPDDNMADLFIQAVLELGYRIPEDIAVLASNNDRGFCESCRVPLSSVEVNFSQLGYESARVLDQLINGEPDVPKLVKIPPLMVVGRSSTENAEPRDPIVSAIREYIREHFAERITADILIHDIHVSRSVAFERFRKIADIRSEQKSNGSGWSTRNPFWETPITRST
jgi:LacI family transcriptional regulator